MPEGYCLATGVEAGRLSLAALCAKVGPPVLAIGYATSLCGRAGYASLRELSEAYGFSLLETVDINSAEVIDAVQRRGPALLVVAGWSQIVKPPLLALFPRGGVGLHPTRLPEGRGRAPIPWTIIKGLTETAVTLFHLEEAVDAGDIVDQCSVRVGPRDDAASLYERIADAHAEILVEHMPALLAGSAPRQPQVGPGSVWPRRRPEDGRIDWSLPAARLYDWVRALTRPYPGAFTTLPEGSVLRVWRADLLEIRTSVAAGTIVGPVWSTSGGGIAVATGEGLVLLTMVQVDGQPEVSALEVFTSGALQQGDRLG